MTMTARFSSDVEARSPLSRQDLDLLARLGSGALTSTIASRLGISERTVRRRLTAICGELGVDTAIEAVVWAARRGLI